MKYAVPILAALIISLGGFASASAAPKADKSAPTTQGADESYVPVQNITTTLITGNNVTGSMRVDMAVYIKNSRKRALFNGQLPRVRARGHEVLLNYVLKQHRFGRMPNANAIRNGLQREVDALIGRGEGEVFLTFLIVHT